MAAFSLRDNWGVGAAAGVAVSLCVGGWAYASMNRHRAEISAAPIRPKAATISMGAPATLDFAAGGATKTSAVAGAAAPPDTAALVVHVTGSVKKPGVYRLKIGDRINDAVVAAGGFKANARQDVLNLADTVRDADQIFVPSTTSLAAKKSQGGSSASSTADYSAAAPEVPRHALIVRGTPVHAALVSASAPQAASFDAGGSNTSDSPSSPAETASTDEPTPPAPEATPGRVLGKSAPVEKGGEVVEEDEPQAVPAPVPTSGPGASPSVSKTASARKSSGSVSKSSGKSGGSSAKFKNPGDGVVHLNRATAQELEKLPGVGPAMSGRILEYRHQIGGFKNIEQMLDVKGIGDKKFAKMRPFLAL